MSTSCDGLVTVREADSEYGSTMDTVRRWIWEGKIPAQKLGNQLFIKRSDLATLRPVSKQDERTAQLALLDEIAMLHQELLAKGYQPSDAARDLDEARESRDR